MAKGEPLLDADVDVAIAGAPEVKTFFASLPSTSNRENKEVENVLQSALDFLKKTEGISTLWVDLSYSKGGAFCSVWYVQGKSGTRASIWEFHVFHSGASGSAVKGSSKRMAQNALKLVVTQAAGFVNEQNLVDQVACTCVCEGGNAAHSAVFIDRARPSARVNDNLCTKIFTCAKDADGEVKRSPEGMVACVDGALSAALSWLNREGKMQLPVVGLNVSQNDILSTHAVVWYVQDPNSGLIGRLNADTGRPGPGGGLCISHKTAVHTCIPAASPDVAFTTCVQLVKSAAASLRTNVCFVTAAATDTTHTVILVHTDPDSPPSLTHFEEAPFCACCLVQ